MKKFFVFGITIALLLISAVAYAALSDKGDVGTGEKIKAYGYLNTLHYNNEVGVAQPTVESTTTIETIVTSEYGFAALPDVPGALIKQGDTKTYTYVVSNEGNATDDYYINCNIIGWSGAAGFTGSGWKVQLINGSNVVTSELGSATSAIRSAALAEDSHLAISVKVLPSATPDQNPNGATVNVQLLVTTESRPAGVYLGANGHTYGGTFESMDYTLTTIEAAAMRMTRMATVDAPALYSGTDRHAAVPGSVITYTIIVTNEGAVYARNIIIVDRVPVSTEAGFMGASGTQNSDILKNVTLTSPLARTNGWTSYYTSEATALMTYEAPGGWISLESINPQVNTLEGLDPTPLYVKWQATQAAAGTTHVLTWGVIIQ